MQRIDGPDPKLMHPIPNNQHITFLKNEVKAPNIFIGDYTYFDDKKSAQDFESENVLYNYDFSKVKLVIGKFCAIAAQVKFIMTGDHRLDAFSIYPFSIFENGWQNTYKIKDLPVKGDIIIGHYK